MTSEMVIQSLELGEITEASLKGQLDQIKRDYLQRRREIAQILHDVRRSNKVFPTLFSDLLWKEAGAAIDALRRFKELRWQERETSLVFLRVLANNLDKVEPEPVCVPFNLARISLGFAIDSVYDGRLETAVLQLELALTHFEEVRDLLRPQKEKARVARFFGHDPVAGHLPSRPGMGSQGGDEWL